MIAFDLEDKGKIEFIRGSTITVDVRWHDS
jgi:hypothetical protein